MVLIVVLLIGGEASTGRPRPLAAAGEMAFWQSIDFVDALAFCQLRWCRRYFFQLVSRGELTLLATEGELMIVSLERRSMCPHHPVLRYALLVVAAVVLAASAAAERVPGAMRVASEPELEPETRQVPNAALVPEVLRLPPAVVASASTFQALAEQEILPGVPYRNGFSRSDSENRVTFAAAVPSAGAIEELSESTVSWLGRFVVEEAYAFRVLLRDVVLPKGARVWVHVGDTSLGPFEDELLDPEGKMWLPPAWGAEAVVEVEVPATAGVALFAPSFTIGEVMELVADPAEGSFDPQVWTDCDVDAMCVSSATLSTIDILREATARLTFVDGAFSFLCSGGLLNDNDPTSFRPYLLTANHCFDSQASASSLVAYFDYRTSGCGGTTPSLGSVPSVSGSTLLATNASSDFTMVELSGNPTGNTWYLGWTSIDPTSGSAMHRVSHPQGSTQRYSASSFTGSAGIVCGGFPTSDFHYSAGTVGSTTGGSSGAPVTDAGANVTGQLFGVCHFQTWDDCNYSTFNYIDGAFSTTFPSVSFWLFDLTGCGDAFEPDDTSGQASVIASGSPQSHSICPAGDDDWVTFSLGQQSGVSLLTSGPSGDTRMTLYNSALSQIEFDDDSGSNLFSSIDRVCGVDPLPAGTYYVHIDEFGDNDQIAEYDLAYTNEGACAGSCPTNLTLSNTTITGTQVHRALDTITLGPSLTISGSDIEVKAGQRVVITSGTAIGGSFSAGTGTSACTI